LAAVVIGWLWSPLLNRVYGTGQGAANANLAYTVCGLAMGGTWADANARYADALAALPSDRARSEFLYRQTVALVRDDPRPFATSLLRNEVAFIRNAPGMLRATVFAGSAVMTVAVTAVLALGLAIGALRRRRDWTLWGGLLAGTLLTMPLIYGDGGWRAIASTWPLMAVFASVGLAQPATDRSGPVVNQSWRPWRDASALTVAAVALGALVGPALVRGLSPRPSLAQCPTVANPDLLIVEQAARAPLVEIVDVTAAAANITAAGMPRVPTLDVRQFLAHVRRSGVEDTARFLDPPPRPFVVFSAYDFGSHASHTLVAPAELLLVQSEWAWLRIAAWGGAKDVSQVVAFGAWQACGSERQSIR
jgi:hypothetical protein